MQRLLELAKQRNKSNMEMMEREYLTETLVENVNIVKNFYTKSFNELWTGVKGLEKEMEKKIELISNKSLNLTLKKIKLALIVKSGKSEQIGQILSKMKKQKIDIVFKANFNVKEKKDCYWISVNNDTLINYQKTVNELYPEIVTVKLKNYIIMGQLLEFKKTNNQSELLIKLIIILNEKNVNMQISCNIEKNGVLSCLMVEKELERKIIGLRQEAEEIIITRYNGKNMKKILKIKNTKENIIMFKNRNTSNIKLGRNSVVICEMEHIKKKNTYDYKTKKKNLSNVIKKKKLQIK